MRFQPGDVVRPRQGSMYDGSDQSAWKRVRWEVENPYVTSDVMTIKSSLRKGALVFRANWEKVEMGPDRIAEMFA